MRQSVKIYYNDKQVCSDLIQERSYSKSPLKPAIYVNQLTDRFNLLNGKISIIDTFKPFRKRDFVNAHTDQYVNGFFSGQKSIRESNGLPWSKALAQSVKYTNSSLFNAIQASIIDPNHIYVSPTSGFHHARPSGGSAFCTFSGQVIASVKLYRKYKVRGAYLDLDGHYGNSIDDSERFIKNKYGWDLKDIIQMNINPYGQGNAYIKDLERQLHNLGNKIKQRKVDYIVWCHGADSHKDDDLGYQLTTSQWISASTTFYTWLDKLEREIGRKVPLTLSLFGGYRNDDYQSVINLHIIDLFVGISILMQTYLPIDGLMVKSKNSTRARRRNYTNTLY